jgi:hypothetical protein
MTTDKCRRFAGIVKKIKNLKDRSGLQHLGRAVNRRTPPRRSRRRPPRAADARRRRRRARHADEFAELVDAE